MGSSHTWERRDRQRSADKPAMRAVFNSADQSDPVDRGLPSEKSSIETSSLKMSAQPLSSYSRFHLHVNGRTSPRSLTRWPNWP